MGTSSEPMLILMSTLCWLLDGAAPLSIERVYQGWNELRAKADLAQGTVTVESREGTGSVGHKTAYAIVRNLSCSKVEILDEDMNPLEVYCVNEKYAFHALRGKQGLWAATEVAPVGQANQLAKKVQNYGQSRLQGATLGLSFAGDLFNSGEAIVNRLVQKDSNSPDLVLEFELRKTNDVSLHTCTNGTLVLDPRMLYCIKEYELIRRFVNGSGISKAQFVFEIRDGVPIARSCTRNEYARLDDGRTLEEVATSNFQLSKPQPLPGSEVFRMSYYGMPEPFGVEWPRPTPWFLYFSAGGFGLFFLGFFLWRVLAKRQARGVA